MFDAEPTSDGPKLATGAGSIRRGAGAEKFFGRDRRRLDLIDSDERDPDFGYGRMETHQNRRASPPVTFGIFERRRARALLSVTTSGCDGRKATIGSLLFGITRTG